MDPDLLCDSPESEVLEPRQENLLGRGMLLCLQISSSESKVNESDRQLDHKYLSVTSYMPEKKGIK